MFPAHAAGAALLLLRLCVAGLALQAVVTTNYGLPVAAMPSGIAVLEVMMASRSDQALAQVLEPLQSGIEADSQERLGQIMREAGMRVNAEAFELIRVIVAAIRGLVIEMVFQRSGPEVPVALHVFETLIEARLLWQKRRTSRGVKT